VLKRSKIDHFRGYADRHLRGVLSISRDETASYICLRMSRCEIRSIIEQINGVLVSKIDFISTHAQKVQYWLFVEVLQIVIYAAFCLFLRTKLRSIYVYASPQRVLRSIIEQH
jgi:hypothetical protein